VPWSQQFPSPPQRFQLYSLFTLEPNNQNPALRRAACRWSKAGLFFFPVPCLFKLASSISRGNLVGPRRSSEGSPTLDLISTSSLELPTFQLVPACSWDSLHFLWIADDRFLQFFGRTACVASGVTAAALRSHRSGRSLVEIKVLQTSSSCYVS